MNIHSPKVALMASAMSLAALGGAGAPAGATNLEAEPVRLFAFDVDPACQALGCLPEDGTFYPGRAEKTGSEFSGEPLEVPQGTDVEFTNLSSEHHNIVSFKRQGGRPAFASEEHVIQGMSSLLGTQYLDPGTYAYFCGHHPTTMLGLIEITD